MHDICCTDRHPRVWTCDHAAALQIGLSAIADAIAYSTECYLQIGTMWFCLTFTISLLPALIKSLGTSLPGKLKLAPHAPSLGWQAL